MRLLAVEPSPVHEYTVWDNIGYSLLLLAFLTAWLCYWVGFKVKAKCLVVDESTQKPCTEDARVILGCEELHKWKKPWAWLRHLGAASWLDRWCNRLHIVPPSFAPMPMPRVATAPASFPAAPQPQTPGTKMTREARIAVWALIFAIIQAGTGIIALVASQ
ncbi:hypothetical protein [Actinoplanes auranticolor]|uniref:hypothetical protein n=1 Tax=Actinoplanes auranticolor TaxID=47988 RepID=UPI001BB3926B|nr:hypothetical protein [Actinoplanes auranticolor]